MDDKSTLDYILEKNKITPPSKVKRFKSGQINRVYDIDDKFIIKIEGNNPDKKGCLLGQKQITDKLIAAGAKVPKILEEDTYQNNRYLLIEKLKGNNLAHVWPDMDDRQRENIIYQLAEQLKLFHTLEFQSFTLMNYRDREFKTFKEAFEDEIKFDSIDRHQLTSEQNETLEYLENFYKNHIQLLDKEEPSVFVHNDIHFENIFIEDDELVGIIDFDRWCKAPRHYELHKIVDVLHTPFRYVEKQLEPSYKQAMPEVLKWLRKYYPELFLSENLLDKLKLYYIDTAIWLINEYQSGHYREGAKIELSEKFKDFYKGDWLSNVLVR